VKSIEITRAIRSTKVNDLKIKRKQPIGLLDGDLVAAGTDNIGVAHQVLDKLDLDKAEIVTIYYGDDVESAEAEEIGASIREQHPQLQIEVIRGGQPHYSYIISVE
jgi:dihydroxyacetone kinase-like predicted kinase